MRQRCAAAQVAMIFDAKVPYEKARVIQTLAMVATPPKPRRWSLWPSLSKRSTRVCSHLPPFLVEVESEVEVSVVDAQRASHPMRYLAFGAAQRAIRRRIALIQPLTQPLSWLVTKCLSHVQPVTALSAIQIGKHAVSLQLLHPPLAMLKVTMAKKITLTFRHLLQSFKQF
jgi:hypothetical protein